VRQWLRLGAGFSLRVRKHNSATWYPLSTPSLVPTTAPSDTTKTMLIAAYTPSQTNNTLFHPWTPYYGTPAPISALLLPPSSFPAQPELTWIWSILFYSITSHPTSTWPDASRPKHQTTSTYPSHILHPLSVPRSHAAISVPHSLANLLVSPFHLALFAMSVPLRVFM